MNEEEQIGAYHFIDYSKKNLNEFLGIINDVNTVICFDLEDSLQDVYSIQKTAEQKKYFRKLLYKFFNESFNQYNIKTGLRINALFTDENALDLIFLSQLTDIVTFDSIFLTKVESKKDIIELEKKLEENNIKCTEIIAVIETKTGFSNLHEIISAESARFRKIAFGHCDYNLDMNYFPFKHQNTGTYWNWVEQIADVIKNSKDGKIEFINSPYLELGNDTGFVNMLAKLTSLFKGKVFQVTMTRKQSIQCKNFWPFRPANYFYAKENEYKTPKEEFAKYIISKFENCKVRNSFAITGGKRLLISPHEYRAAVKYLRSSLA